MSRLRSNMLGYYIPSFFEMHVDTDHNDMTINKLPPKDMTTLFHEYIHFLQDFTTYYGLNGLYVHSEYIHSVVTRIYSLNANQVKVPFVINDNKDNVLLNKQIKNLTDGDSSDKSTLIVFDILEDTDNLMQNNYMSSIPNVIINPNSDMIVFGAEAIRESMAYIMERCCSPTAYAKSPDFPYMVAECVANYYVPGFGDDKLKVLALCDMSLMSSNPGSCFVRVMKGVRDGAVTFSTPEEIYDYFYIQVATYADGRQESMLLSNYKHFLGVVESLMKSYLRDMPIVDSYYEWIDRLVAFAIDWRENDRYFLLKMARHTDLATNGCFGKAVHDVGTPLMSNNNKGQYFKVVPHGMDADMNVEYFKAFQEIENVFLDGSCVCSLYDWCQQSPNSTPDNNCKTSPWKKCSDTRMCPFALTWKHWKLSGIEPIQ